MLDPKQRTAAVLLARGETKTSVASSLGISDRTLRRWMDSEEFQVELEGLRAMFSTAVQEGAANAAERARSVLPEVVEHMLNIIRTGKRDRYRIQAAELLGRWGGLEKTRHEVLSLNANVGPDVLQAAVQGRLMELAAQKVGVLPPPSHDESVLADVLPARYEAGGSDSVRPSPSSDGPPPEASVGD